MATAQQLNLDAYNKAMLRPLAVVVKDLLDLLGARLVAYIGGVKEARAAREWAGGVRDVKSEVTAQRLRYALHVALLIADVDSPAVVRAWFIGMNPELDDRSPARLLRDGDPHDVGPEVLAAARAFAAGG